MRACLKNERNLEAFLSIFIDIFWSRDNRQNVSFSLLLAIEVVGPAGSNIQSLQLVKLVIEILPPSLGYRVKELADHWVPPIMFTEDRTIG